MHRYMILFTLLALSTAAGADDISFRFSIEADQVELSSWMGWDVVSIPEGVVPFREGEPSLQGVAYTFVIPQGTSIEDVSVEVLGSEALPGSYRIAPVTYSILSRPFEPASPSPVYSSPEGFPDRPVSAWRSGGRSGFRLGGFVLVPFVYDPLSGDLRLITAADVTVRCSNDASAETVSLTGRQLAAFRPAVEQMVENPEALSAWSPATRSDTDGDPVWVAIGDSGMASVLEPLVAHRNLHTGEAEYVTVQYITENYTGYDTPEKIRNYLKDQFQNHSLVYALIVGDYGETTRISSYAINSGQTVLNNVADHYYIDLDGTWDGDGDHKYGEAGDGINYYSDLYVGRFCSDSENFLENMVEKTISYETTTPEGDWRTTALLMGAGLWPPDYWGSFVCEDIAEYIPAYWTVEKLYEDEYGHPNNQIDIINEGCSFGSVHGHGNWGGIYWYDYAPTEMVATTNYADMHNIDMLTVFHSIACMAGELTEGACIAERLMLSPFGGAIAVMFNSSYGWGTPPARGPSEWLEIKFAEQLFGFGVTQIGVIQCNAKDEIQSLVTVPLIDWVTQENNLLGDPAVIFIAGQTGIEEGDDQAPAAPILYSPAPNPARYGCSIAYDLPASGEFSVTVFDMAGRAVRELHSGMLPQGSGSLSFDGMDGSGAPLPSGVYSVVLAGPSGTGATRMVIAR
ncbi:MAG: hypothetical protein AVO35_08880 [Candidatus Aegiribacteria sp. MLS_C]|nr:MAG: hypothetical protein AVO35_08880 [Candidatus Aegiribacteria sp. MLS_C]